MPRRKPREGGDTAVATEKKTRTDRPRLWRVLLHNDDFTTMEFVVKVLMELFNKSAAEATDLMLQVHRRGACVAGAYPHEVAETKVAAEEQISPEGVLPILCELWAEQGAHTVL